MYGCMYIQSDTRWQHKDKVRHPRLPCFYYDNFCLRCLLLPIGSNSVCWTQTNDVHGFDGIPHNFTNLHECQTACIDDSTCEAIDWEPSNAGNSCWILTSTVAKNTMDVGVITHYELHRTNLGLSCFYIPFATDTVYIVLFILINCT